MGLVDSCQLSLGGWRACSLGGHRNLDMFFCSLCRFCTFLKYILIAELHYPYITAAAKQEIYPLSPQGDWLYPYTGGCQLGAVGLTSPHHWVNDMLMLTEMHHIHIIGCSSSVPARRFFVWTVLIIVAVRLTKCVCICICVCKGLAKGVCTVFVPV